MKKLIFGFAVLFSSYVVQAQSSFESTMKESIQKLEKATSAEEFAELSALFSKASDMDSKNWLPGYYKTLSDVKTGELLLTQGKTKELGKIGDQILKNATNSMILAKGNNIAESEIYVLEGLGHFYKLMTNPEQNFKTESDAMRTSFKDAEAKNPKNPRILMARAIMIYFLPDNIGGSKEKGALILEESVSNFDLFKAKPMYPNWGKAEAELLLKTKP